MYYILKTELAMTSEEMMKQMDRKRNVTEKHDTRKASQVKYCNSSCAFLPARQRGSVRTMRWTIKMCIRSFHTHIPAPINRESAFGSVPTYIFNRDQPAFVHSDTFGKLGGREEVFMIC